MWSKKHENRLPSGLRRREEQSRRHQWPSPTSWESTAALPHQKAQPGRGLLGRKRLSAAKSPAGSLPTTCKLCSRPMSVLNSRGLRNLEGIHQRLLVPSGKHGATLCKCFQFQCAFTTRTKAAGCWVLAAGCSSKEETDLGQQMNVHF